jgi:hypothetical protein
VVISIHESICTIARHERHAHPDDAPAASPRPIRRPDEISIAVNWAAAEGWNPGLADGAQNSPENPLRPDSVEKDRQLFVVVARAPKRPSGNPRSLLQKKPGTHRSLGLRRRVEVLSRPRSPMWLARSSQVQPIEQPCHRPAMPAATARRGGLPLCQLVSDLLDRQVAQLDQDQPQRLCRFAQSSRHPFSANRAGSG